MRALVSQSVTVPVAKEGAAQERARLVRCLDRNERPTPSPSLVQSRPYAAELRDQLQYARKLAENAPLRSLYQQRLDEVELDFLINDARNDIKLLRPLLARRYGTGKEIASVAEHVLRNATATPEQAVLAAEDAHGGPSFAQLIRDVALHAGLELRGVKVEDDLLANAVASGAWIRIANRPVGPREALRCAAHEVLGHVVSTFNAQAQSQEIFALGTAFAFEDQEGVALVLEEMTGALDAERLRVLAARVIATLRFHEGARFEDIAVLLHREHALLAHDAIAITERTFRGGGSAREACYLSGFLKIRRAIKNGEAHLDELRNGKISLQALPVIRDAITAGIVRPPPFRPTLERALAFIDLAAFAERFDVDAALGVD